MNAEILFTLLAATPREAWTEFPRSWTNNIVTVLFNVKSFLPITFTRCSSPFRHAIKCNPGWALIDIQSFSALIQRFLRFQRCSELNQPTLILTSLVITDSVMNISEHLWFSAEHYWQAANRQRSWKKPTKSVFLSILMLKRREIENFRITFNGIFWKILKMWFFRNLFFLLIPCQKTSY